MHGAGPHEHRVVLRAPSVHQPERGARGEIPGGPLSPMNPSMLWAIFTWTYGIARAICFRKNLFNCLASASRRPHDTRIPAPRSARIPLPATKRVGVLHCDHHGPDPGGDDPLRAWWGLAVVCTRFQVTNRVVPARLPRANRRQSTSACGPPNRRCQPRAMILFPRTRTAPTSGFGLTRPFPRDASFMHSRMKRSSGATAPWHVPA